MNPNEVPRITPGMTLAVEEADYLYGAGMVLLIVQSISVDLRRLPNMKWVRLDCLRLRADGSVEDEFSPLVRRTALAAAVRPTGWLPPGPMFEQAQALPAVETLGGRPLGREPENG